MALSNIYQHTKNPANIRFSEDNNWLGQCGQYKGFCSFIDQIYGVRALRVLLHNYIFKGYDHVDTIIRRFAPSSENNTNDYISYIWEEFIRYGYNVHSAIKIDSAQFRLLMVCICKYETGYELSLEEYNYVCSRFI